MKYTYHQFISFHQSDQYKKAVMSITIALKTEVMITESLLLFGGVNLVVTLSITDSVLNKAALMLGLTEVA